MPKNTSAYLFHEGTNYKIYQYFGSHFENNSWVFRVWAPTAKDVFVVGDFNNWDSTNLTEKTGHCIKISDGGIWECSIENAKEFDAYKYMIISSNGQSVLKADPVSCHNETRPGTASKLYNCEGFEWNDSAFIKKREKTDYRQQPVNIYEVHAGSWRRYIDNNTFDYQKLANELVKYVKDMNYTHIELMPISEYPYDKSWGYQVTGYFSPTSRYGTPKDFMEFVDLCHKNNIGVILDWVPAHFPKDEFGLALFDGTPCYEYKEIFKGEHPDWGTKIFDYGKNEVISFLISSVYNWLENYHIDGIRVDAVASMLYLDYGRKDGEWIPNKYGKNGNLEAEAFLKTLNTAVSADFKGIMMIAEESTAWPKVTHSIEEGGLGFTFKWNMGWMNDTIKYMQSDPFFRKGIHSNITFSFSYANSEEYILPLSHDEVVHGKCSLIEKMPGNYIEKFENLKAYFGYMFAHPGKKLTFMGSEFAHFAEWNEEKELDWFLLKYPSHKNFKKFTKTLNQIYKKHSAFWKFDSSERGFNWISGEDTDKNIICFIRKNVINQYIIIICNFSSLHLKDYNIGVPFRGEYKLLLNTASTDFGGKYNLKEPMRTKRIIKHGFKQSMVLELPPFSTLYYIYEK